ncbi:MAG: S8 family serine peptidase [candidate division KSB1 bacterium]|nr:S8 family serine peptidase [candidate division KSB1 bacterium]MDZ7413534.1 S8 family serine peptidase [candidate division KSB1 bacterium]
MRSRLLVLTVLFGGVVSAWSYAASGGHAQARYWIFFVDKGPMPKSMGETVQLPPRVLWRRAKVLPPGQLVDECDRPLYEPYLERLHSLGVRPVLSSRWLNAVSAPLDEGQLAAVRKLPFVKKVQPVAMRRRLPEPEAAPGFQPVPKPGVQTYEYGPSLQQNALVRVPEVHNLGIDGTGVRIGMLDTGFRYQLSEAFQRLRVVAEFDFINGDSVTHNEEGQDVSSQEVHGTGTLSVIGGFSPGRLIGPAFGAEYVLAKTEYVPSETPVEEDFWVAGLEWLESMGVDVVSSSLGYLDWYTYQDMDGNTAVTTRAADIAVRKGVVVVNSAGNEGNSSWRYVIAPADGDSVIAVGAVDDNGVLAPFSSRGPTADGRVKPDVVAMGVRVYMAGPLHATDFRLGSGTSFSCPMVAGVAALILAAHPWLTPMQVGEALRQTADRAGHPDNEYGWGLVDAWRAVLYYGPAFTPFPTVRAIGEEDSVEVLLAVAGDPPIRPDGVMVYWGEDSTALEMLVKMGPTEREHHYVAKLPAPREGRVLYVCFAAQDVRGRIAVHPHDAPQSLFCAQAGDSSLRLLRLPQDSTAPPGQRVPTSFIVHPLYPNPFPAAGRPYTTVEIELPEPRVVSAAIYDLLGRRVASLLDSRPLLPRVHRFSWHGKDDQGRELPSGVYFCRVEAGQHATVRKLVKVR